MKNFNQFILESNNMKISAIKDFRNVSGEYDFEDSVTVIVGENGSGKSSLLKSIIATFKKNKTSSGNVQEIDRDQLKNLVNMNKQFDNIVYLSKDDDFNLTVSSRYNATQHLGDYLIYKDKSSGQQFIDMFANRCMKAIDDANENKSTLLMFDEIDAHFDIKNQSFAAKLLNKIKSDYSQYITVLYTTHHLGIILKADKVYDFKSKSFKTADDILNDLFI